MFFILSCTVFIFAGLMLRRMNFEVKLKQFLPHNLNDIIFCLITLLGLINIFLMGYLPLLHREHNYREFGVRFIDPVFNSLSIFFSVFFLQTFLNYRKKRFLIYLFVIFILQLLVFRRSTIVWIFVSSLFLIIYYYRRIRISLFFAFIISIPLLSWCFGQYGNYRSRLSKSFIINDLGASTAFKRTGLSQNHYITYLYATSPLANLQKNIDEGKDFINKRDFKSLISYNIIPESIALRTQNTFRSGTPITSLIHPELIVGTFFMLSFISMGWLGMIIMLIFLCASIIICIYLSNRWNAFQVTTLSILSTTVSLLVFSNFLNRMDVLMMLFLYPVLFHFVYKFAGRGISKTITDL